MILFCIPYSGGGAEAFAGWREALAPTVDVRVAALPGRGERFGVPLVRDMPTLVEQMAEQCESWSSEPFALLGYSFGAAVAYALTLHLQQRGRAPRRLIAGAARAPFLPHVGPMRHQMADPALIAELVAFGATDPAVLADDELMRVYLPILRSDFEVAETYRPAEQKVACPLSVFGGTRDVFTPVADLKLWSRLSDRDTNVRLYEGGHFVLHTHRARICRAVRADLALDAYGVTATTPDRSDIEDIAR
ncbi:alpha/beta fold hydrolase [Micromonospora sp. CPCC 205546]|uniref:thioesterase II family protein n=1 Tax=Micromonospora sp. CPCC 205546 TaxID=3122397 RepID=UPI002FF048EC